MGTNTITSAACCFIPSSSRFLKTCKAVDSIDLTTPVPAQCGHGCVLASMTLGRNRCRESSINPNWLIRLICILARSDFTTSRIFLSIACWFLFSYISIKSITTNPAKSRSFNCLAISSAASKFVFRAVSSMLRSLVDRPEFTSTATKASV